MSVISNFVTALKMIKEDKVLLLLSFIPVFIGLIFYGLLGGWIFTSVIPWGNDLVQGWLSIDWLGSFLGWIVKAIISILFFFAVNWTFFLVVSLLASPFNDLISSRVEKKLKNVELDNFSRAFSGVFNKLGFTLVNESKKVVLIVFFSFISLTLSFFPLLSPLTIFIQSILVAVNFLDYSWARNDYTISECIHNYKTNFFINTLGGLIGVTLLSIPGINIISLPILVIFNTINFARIT